MKEISAPGIANALEVKCLFTFKSFALTQSQLHAVVGVSAGLFFPHGDGERERERERARTVASRMLVKANCFNGFK